MKQLVQFATGVALVCALVPAYACDVCGCSGAGNTLGLLPLVQRHFIGLRTQVQSFETAPHHTGDFLATETYHSFDLWGRWQPHRRVQVIGILPYVIANHRNGVTPTLQSSGIGDAMALAQFSVLDPVRQNKRLFQHTIQIGAGVKLSTGTFSIADSEGEQLPANLQPGTGSTDYLLSGFYAIRKGSWGVSLDAIARLSTENPKQYHFGNRLNAGVQVFWSKTIRRWNFVPAVGLSFDGRQEDRYLDKWKGETGGYALATTLGVQVFRGNLAFNIQWSLPAVHQMGDGLITPVYQLGAGVAVLIPNKKSPKATTPVNVFQNVSAKSN
ncbi:MAG: hypothetical protein JNJ57_10155 [Saprospiraceae bacterium]|nr:hypothetical protein [Saprospiraceae bacterium]